MATKPAPREYTPADGIGQRLMEVQRLTLKIDAAKAALEREKEYLLGHVTRNNFPGLRCQATLVSPRVTVSWTYSDAVKKAEASLKALKQKEQKNGTAVKRDTSSLVVTISGKAALLQAAAASTLNAILERTPSAGAVIRGTDLVPRTWEEGEMEEESFRAIQS
jgi:hypothetical protein